MRNLFLGFCFWISQTLSGTVSSFSLQPTYATLSMSFNPFRSPLMEWVTPQHEEIDLNCEISSYANAEL